MDRIPKNYFLEIRQSSRPTAPAVNQEEPEWLETGMSAACRPFKLKKVVIVMNPDYSRNGTSSQEKTTSLCVRSRKTHIHKTTFVNYGSIGFTFFIFFFVVRESRAFR